MYSRFTLIGTITSELKTGNATQDGSVPYNFEVTQELPAASNGVARTMRYQVAYWHRGGNLPFNPQQIAKGVIVMIEGALAPDLYQTKEAKQGTDGSSPLHWVAYSSKVTAYVVKPLGFAFSVGAAATPAPASNQWSAPTAHAAAPGYTPPAQQPYAPPTAPGHPAPASNPQAVWQSAPASGVQRDSNGDPIPF